MFQYYVSFFLHNFNCLTPFKRHNFHPKTANPLSPTEAIPHMVRLIPVTFSNTQFHGLNRTCWTLFNLTCFVFVHHKTEGGSTFATNFPKSRGIVTDTHSLPLVKHIFQQQSQDNFGRRNSSNIFSFQFGPLFFTPTTFPPECHKQKNNKLTFQRHFVRSIIVDD